MASFHRCDFPRNWRRSAYGVVALLGLAGCPGTSGLPLTQPVPSGNRPPTIQITAPAANITVENGSLVVIAYTGSDGEDTARITLLVDLDQNPASGNEIVLRNDLSVGPGTGSGQITWNTTGVTAGTYFPFAIIDDGHNPAVTVAGAGSIQVLPKGTKALSAPPAITILGPVSNLGDASGDTVTIAYNFRDPDSTVKVTLLLDKDQNPSNDDVNSPGDPLDPKTNIIILPSEARHADDPLLTPDLPGVTPTGTDSVQIRTNPRTFPSTPPGQSSTDKLYLFTVDFSKIPVRTDGLPYFIRATISDGDNPPVHVYATSPLTITGLASGFVDLADVGVKIAGARFQGFSANEQLGTQIINAGDGDNDSINDFMLVGRFASPRNRFQAGAAYLIRGRRKVPFPTTDHNTNGLPDQPGSTGNDLDFPTPPPYISPPPAFVNGVSIFPTPYQPKNVGRFGGTISINSVGSLFRGSTFPMPLSHARTPPPVAQRVAEIPNLTTAGLTSVAQVDINSDGIPDYIFGLPFISSPIEAHDDDPCDGDFAAFPDGFPNAFCDQTPGNVKEDIWPRFTQPIDTGLVIAVSGANDVENDGSANTPTGHTAGADGVVFRLIVDAGLAGQFDPVFAQDDEGVIWGGPGIPVGMRWRGAWFGDNLVPPIETIVDGIGVEGESFNEYGADVARIPSYDNDALDELAISVPGHNNNTGRVDVWKGGNLIGGPGSLSDNVLSLPQYACTPVAGISCVRGFWATPIFIEINGKAAGDRFGYCRPAGQFNQDGVNDLLAGSPGASVDGLNSNGVTYILLTPAGGFGNTSLATQNIPRVEIHGTHNNDHFGQVHDTVGDLNGDGIDDVAIASPNYDDDSQNNQNAGYVGVIFGKRPITGEKVFYPEQVGTAALSGVRFLGATAGAMAGASVSSAGDFNQDGFGDLLIASPGEFRTVNGVSRHGVAYLIFGGPHLVNKTFNLSAVGSPALPGIVFVSPYAAGSADEAPIEVVGGIGDVDGDGFDDIGLGAPHADFVNTASPNQRRVDAGEVWLVYGSNFGTNKLKTTP